MLHGTIDIIDYVNVYVVYNIYGHTHTDDRCRLSDPAFEGGAGGSNRSGAGTSCEVLKIVTTRARIEMSYLGRLDRVRVIMFRRRICEV